MAEKLYSVIGDGQGIVEKLVELYPDVLWQVRTNQVAVLGIENKEPTKRSAKFRVRCVKNAEKAVFKINKIDIRYIIELYWSEWNQWTAPRKEWTIMNALLRISVDEDKMIKPDCVEFKIILDKVGFDWDNEHANLPSLTEAKVDFDLDLRPGLDEDKDDEDEED